MAVVGCPEKNMEFEKRKKNVSESTEDQPAILRGHNFFSFFSISLTIGASRLMEVQMYLPHLLFGVGFQIFYSDASNVYVLS